MNLRLGWPEIWPENWAATSDLFDSAQELGGLQPLILRGIRPQGGARPASVGATGSLAGRQPQAQGNALHMVAICLQSNSYTIHPKFIAPCFPDGSPAHSCAARSKRKPAARWGRKNFRGLSIEVAESLNSGGIWREPGVEKGVRQQVQDRCKVRWSAQTIKSGDRDTKENTVTNGTYNIQVRFEGGLTTAQEAAFTSASDRWSQIISADVPRFRLNGEVV